MGREENGSFVQCQSQHHSTPDCDWRLALQVTQLQHPHLENLRAEMKHYSTASSPAVFDFDAVATVACRRRASRRNVGACTSVCRRLWRSRDDCVRAWSGLRVASSVSSHGARL